MIRVGIREMRDAFGSFIERLRRGEHIMLTDRGNVDLAVAGVDVRRRAEVEGCSPVGTRGQGIERRESRTIWNG